MCLENPDKLRYKIIRVTLFYKSINRKWLFVDKCMKSPWPNLLCCTKTSLHYKLQASEWRAWRFIPSTSSSVPRATGCRNLRSVHMGFCRVVSLTMFLHNGNSYHSIAIRGKETGLPSETQSSSRWPHGNSAVGPQLIRRSGPTTRDSQFTT